MKSTAKSRLGEPHRCPARQGGRLRGLRAQRRSSAYGFRVSPTSLTRVSTRCPAQVAQQARIWVWSPTGRQPVAVAADTIVVYRETARATGRRLQCVPGAAAGGRPGDLLRRGRAVPTNARVGCGARLRLKIRIR